MRSNLGLYLSVKLLKSLVKGEPDADGGEFADLTIGFNPSIMILRNFSAKGKPDSLSIPITQFSEQVKDNFSILRVEAGSFIPEF